MISDQVVRWSQNRPDSPSEGVTVDDTVSPPPDGAADELIRSRSRVVSRAVFACCREPLCAFLKPGAYFT